MGLDMESMMRKLEKKYPNLINCLGRLDTMSDKCSRCKYAYSCLQIRRDLKRRCFARGRYRYGFGRMKISRKHDLRWEFEQYEL